LIEKELIEECRSGNFQNFRKVIEKTSPMVFSVAFRMLGDEDIARDIVQDTMVTIWQKLIKIKTIDSYKTWVYRITMNKCYDQLRRRRRLPECRFDDETWALISNHTSSDGVTELENKENAQIINFLTNKLSHKQKAVFILSELEEMSSDEIVKVTGMNRSAVKANLYYARKNIETLLQKYL
jgi:RNA polymerase sigma-70 factor (ECF subfamily)